MKVCIYIAILFFAFQAARSQKINRVTGTAKDSVTGQSVPFVSVSMLTTQKKVAKNIISDSLGNFSLTGIAAGNYSLVLSAVGYKRFLLKDLVITGTSNINTGLLLLSPDTAMLKEVVISGSRSIVSASVNGFIYNPENDIIATGTTAADLLHKIPMITVGQNGSPVLRGSGNIRVFIDDKPSDIYAPSVADALKQIPAEDIVRVEVILYPSAKYDAEGTDGVINIITRKSRFNAVNGTMRSQIGNRSKSFTPDISIRNGNWIFNTNLGINFNNSLDGSTLTRKNISANSTSLLNQKGESNNHGKAFYIGTNIIYVINQLQAISFGYRFRINRSYANRSIDNKYYRDDSLVTAFIRNTDNVSGNDLHSFNLAWNGKSRNQQHQYSLLAVYFSHKGMDSYDMDQFRQQSLDYKERFNGRLGNTEFSFQADYAQNMNDKIKWDAGAKSVFREYGSANDFEVYEFFTGIFAKDQNRSNQFNYQRNIHAIYSNLNLNFNSLQIRIGARYEQTVLQSAFRDTSIAVPDYKNLVPSVLISKAFGKNNILKWSYGRRISRPLLSALNPLINYIDSFNIQSGYPYLQPEITNRYEIGYTLNVKQLFLIASLYYNSTHNAIEAVRLPVTEGIYSNTYRNIGKNDVMGLSVSVTWKWKQKLTAISTINFRQSYFESKALQQNNRGFQCGVNVNLSYAPGKGYSVDAMGNISSDDINLQGRREGWRFYAIIINKKLKGDKFSISARMDNFFPPAYQNLSQSWKSPVFSQSLSTRYQNHYFLLSFSWKWGKKEVKAPALRQEVNSEN